jgi:hypothetical protein
MIDTLYESVSGLARSVNKMKLELEGAGKLKKNDFFFV